MLKKCTVSCIYESAEEVPEEFCAVISNKMWIFYHNSPVQAYGMDIFDKSDKSFDKTKRDPIPHVRKVLKRTENDQKYVSEELAKQRNRLVRKKTLLEDAKMTIDDEFLALQAFLEELDATSGKYLSERTKLMSVTSKYVSLLLESSKEHSVTTSNTISSSSDISE